MARSNSTAAPTLMRSFPMPSAFGQALVLLSLVLCTVPASAAIVRGQASGVIVAGTDPLGEFGLAGDDSYAGTRATLSFKIDTDLAPAPEILAPDDPTVPLARSAAAAAPGSIELYFTETPLPRWIFDLTVTINGITRSLPPMAGEPLDEQVVIVDFDFAGPQPPADVLAIQARQGSIVPEPNGIDFAFESSGFLLVASGPDNRSNTGSLPLSLPLGALVTGLGEVEQNLVGTCDGVTGFCDFSSGWGQTFLIDEFSLAPVAVPLPPAVLLLGGGLIGLVARQRRGAPLASA